MRVKQESKLNLLKMTYHYFQGFSLLVRPGKGDLEEFFSHENQVSPPSLSVSGKLRLGKKSDLLKCLVPDGQLQRNSRPSIDVKILVNMLPPMECKTFADYTNKIFIPYLQNQLKSIQRLDIVWDRYIPNSLKNSTRENLGQSVRRKVTADGVLPKNWNSFLRCNDNKKELFPFLSKAVIKQITTPQIFATIGNEVISSQGNVNINNELAPCNHEEGDTRMLVHAKHATKISPRILFKTVDTDVVVTLLWAVFLSRHL